ncbi:MAG: DUF1398 family protein [Hyphomonadaceae bacterium]
MHANAAAVVEACNAGSESGAMRFPDVLAQLAAIGCEGYLTDFRRGAKTFYFGAEALETKSIKPDAEIAERFDAAGVEAAVRRSQAGAHTYPDFCREAMEAGCAAYMVSIAGRRVLYFGRTAEIFVEPFPSKD